MIMMPICMANYLLLCANMIPRVVLSNMDYFRSPAAKAGTLLHLLSACGPAKELLPIFEALAQDDGQGGQNEDLLLLLPPHINTIVFMGCESNDILKELGTLPANMASEVEVIRSTVVDKVATGHLLALCVRILYNYSKGEAVGVCFTTSFGGRFSGLFVPSLR